MKGLSLKKRIWLAKHTTEFCAVGMIVKRRDERIHTECPRCEISDESVDHIVLCEYPDANHI